jgi:hypothetical protein
MTLETDLFTPRTPTEINLELRKKYERMNDYSKGKTRKGAEDLAMEIQRCQLELQGSMRFYIKEVTKP